MITILQAIVLLFVLFAASRAFLRLKDKQISVSQFIFWMIVWKGISIVLFILDMTTVLANFFGIGRGLDFVVYLCIILLFYLIFRLYVQLDFMEQQVTKLVR